MENEKLKLTETFTEITPVIQRENDKIRLETFIKLIEDVDRPKMETTTGNLLLDTFIRQLENSKTFVDISLIHW